MIGWGREFCMEVYNEAYKGYVWACVCVCVCVRDMYNSLGRHAREFRVGCPSMGVYTWYQKRAMAISVSLSVVLGIYFAHDECLFFADPKQTFLFVLIYGENVGEGAGGGGRVSDDMRALFVGELAS